MSNNIRWGVIGCGGIARRRTIPEGIVAADNAELAVVYDVNSQASAEVAKEFNVAAVDSVDEFLVSDIDAAYIATPANLHYEQVIACAKAGKHILCEKPLGMNIEEAEKMTAFCEEAKVILGTAFMMRFQSQHQQALQMIKEGKLGRLVLGRAQLSCWYPPIEGAWRQDPDHGGGGSLMDMGGHCIDLLEMFFGKVKKVSCFINNSVHDYKSEDSAVVNLFFENGAMGIVDTFFCIPDKSSKNVLELYGSGGSILARGTIGQGDTGEMIAFLEDSAAAYDAQQGRDARAGIKIKSEAINTYLAEVQEISRAIINGDKPANDAKIGIQSQKVINACYKSAAAGRVINIE
ncbi:MAG: Gfo/Idh/MocA family oxidoreductase [Sedimentisphaerales bacterium]|nr:Gfo/Idh/MocA family oxidoreductase [Sedimentisphaerales bacterium]